jgi:hypothetical protein
VINDINHSSVCAQPFIAVFIKNIASVWIMTEKAPLNIKGEVMPPATIK